MNIKITNFTLHNAMGEAVRAAELIDWSLKQKPWRAFNTSRYSWEVNGRRFESPNNSYWCELPDASGFICFESEWKSDNCRLLDAYGKEIRRLTVPWDLTGLNIPKDAVMCFKNVSEPCKNPKDGKLGQFGVSAWIEGSGSGGYAEGDWYFELDYHTGKFLWGKEIRS